MHWNTGLQNSYFEWKLPKLNVKVKDKSISYLNSVSQESLISESFQIYHHKVGINRHKIEEVHFFLIFKGLN